MKNGPDQENVSLLDKCMYGAVDASARWQSHYAHILKEHSIPQGFSNPASFVHVREEKWFEEVSFSKNDGKCMG